MNRTSTESGLMPALRDSLPMFTRQPLTVNGISNPSKDVIINSSTGMPVDVVSKTYELVQYPQVYDQVTSGLQKAGFKPDEMKAQIYLAENGEQFEATFELPGYKWTPKDNYPIILRGKVINSVDRTTAVHINLEWMRLVCGNALAYGMGGFRFHRAHRGSDMFSEDMSAAMQEQLGNIDYDKELFNKWMTQKVSTDQIKDWVDGSVNKYWGGGSAARANKIISSQQDAKPLSLRHYTDEKTRFRMNEHPSERDFHTEVTEVPGQPTDQTMWNAAQALSWITSKTSNRNTQFYHLLQMPGLLESLETGTPPKFKNHYAVASRIIDADE